MQVAPLLLLLQQRSIQGGGGQGAGESRERQAWDASKGVVPCKGRLRPRGLLLQGLRLLRLLLLLYIAEVDSSRGLGLVGPQCP